MHVILRTISSFFPHQKILFLSKVMPLKICDTSPGFANSIKPGKILVNFSADFSGISDRRLVDNCLKLTAYEVIGGNESKTVTLDA